VKFVCLPTATTNHSCGRLIITICSNSRILKGFGFFSSGRGKKNQKNFTNTLASFPRSA
jgi:hypothetical protein